jgi:predicted site-specific integrase-resolvase
MTAASQEPFLNEVEASVKLGVKVTRLRKWIKSGAMPGRVLPDGKEVVVLKDDLNEWILDLPNGKAPVPEPEK